MRAGMDGCVTFLGLLSALLLSAARGEEGDFKWKPAVPLWCCNPSQSLTDGGRPNASKS